MTALQFFLLSKCPFEPSDSQGSRTNRRLRWGEAVNSRLYIWLMFDSSLQPLRTQKHKLRERALFDHTSTIVRAMQSLILMTGTATPRALQLRPLRMCLIFFVCFVFFNSHCGERSRGEFKACAHMDANEFMLVRNRRKSAVEKKRRQMKGCVMELKPFRPHMKLG